LQQRLVRQHHRAAKGVTQELAARVPLEFLPAMSRDSNWRPRQRIGSFQLLWAEFD
jgi:hypothetical protein